MKIGPGDIYSPLIRSSIISFNESTPSLFKYMKELINMSVFSILWISLFLFYTGEVLFALACIIKKQSSQATFVGTKLFIISSIGFCLFRILMLFYMYVIRHNMQLIGILPILEDSAGYFTLIDVVCNLFYMDLMIRFVHMSLHTVNSHPLVSVVNEKVDVFVSTIWPIVIISLCSVTSVVCFMVHLITSYVMMYILTGLFSLFYILLISRWIQYLNHAKKIVQNSLIPTSIKMKQLASMVMWVSTFVISFCVRIGLLIFTLFTPIKSFTFISCFLLLFEIIPLLLALIDVFQSLKTTELYQGYFNDITTVLGDVIAV